MTSDRMWGAGKRWGLAVLVVACLAAPARGAVEDELTQADRAFAAATAARGIEGWMEWMAGDAVRLAMHGAIARGAAAIRAQDTELFADPDTRLVWEPTEGVAYATGDLGLTRGRYRVERRQESGEWATVSTGVYVTMWRRQPEGWRVIFDTGSPDPPKAAD
jgi:ketosteroid isomerase-like protein